jgi:hypothetical protein
MNNDEALKIIDANLPRLVNLMLTIQKGTQVDVFCDESGKSFSFFKPFGEANIKLCSVAAPDLEGCYGIHRNGDSFVTDEGEEIPADQLASRLTQYITDMRDGGAEWGWEFRLSGG